MCLHLLDSTIAANHLRGYVEENSDAQCLNNQGSSLARQVIHSQPLSLAMPARKRSAQEAGLSAEEKNIVKQGIFYLAKLAKRR